jgi:hypothetical protein
MQNGKVIQWHDNPRGFVYDTTEQRLLKSSASGFAAADSKKAEANVGLIDWTDGVNQITWIGHQRYLPPIYGNPVVIFKNNHKFDFSSIIGGYICGAAFKNGVFILFVKTPLMGLMAFFVSGNTITDSFTIGDYNSILQIVCISPDCTKAAFIAVPIGQSGSETIIVELAINLSSPSVVIIDTTVQDIHDPVDYAGSRSESDGETWSIELPTVYLDILYTYDYLVGLNPDYGSNPLPIPIYSGGTLYSINQDPPTYHIGSTPHYSTYSYSRATTRIIVAVDYDASNTKKTFFIETEFSHYENWMTGITLAEGENYVAARCARTRGDVPVSEVVDFVEASGWYDINTGAVLPFPSSELRAIEYTTTATINYNGTVRLINLTSETTPDNFGHWYKDYNFLMIDTLDLRHDLIAYTDVNEYEHWRNGIRLETTQLKKYSLQIGSYIQAIRSNNFTDIAGLRFEPYLFKSVEMLSGFHPFGILFSIPVFFDVFSLRIQFSFSDYHSPTVINLDVPVAVLFHDISSIIRGTAIAITDRYNNKLIELGNIESIISAIDYQITFGYNAPIFVKIDNTNTLHTNSITNLKGII